MIIVDNGKQYRVPAGRLARVIQWLIDHRDQIERADKIKVTFDFAGERIHASISQNYQVNK